MGVGHQKNAINVDNVTLLGRHRKIRCVFRPNNPSACISCFSHGIRCASQAESEPVPPTHARLNLSERVSQLEKELATLRAHSDATPNKKGQVDTKKHVNEPVQPTVSFRTSSEITFPLSALPSPAAEGLLILSLFDNAILTTNGSKNVLNDSISREFNTCSLRPASYESSPHFRKSRIKRAKICEDLTDLLPSHSAMYEILETGGFWWDILRTLHPYMCCEDPKMTIQSYVFLALNQDNPAVIGCAISWLAMSLQCLPTSYETGHLGLPLPLNDLTQHYVSTVDRLIVCDDEISLSLEGIECIILQGQFYGNVGRPRKGWTVVRKALSHAVLLGLHLSSSQGSTASSPHSQRRDNVWWHLVQCDAYLSLMLGLPSFTTPTLLDCEIEHAGVINSEHYRRKLAILVGKIGQRNQTTQASLTTLLSTTIQIDHELDMLARHLEPVSWNPTMPSPTYSIKGALTNHESVITHFWHYQAKAYLHLPFMLQHPASSEYDYNRTACLSGSREIVQVYIRIRELAGGKINLCRVVDFQTFTAAVILILGLLGYRPISVPRDITQEAGDWNLVYQTLEVLRVVTTEPENLIAAQCFQALETLVSIANGQFSADGDSSERKIFIPYFGMINISPGSNFAVQGNVNPLEEAAMSTAAKAQVQNPVIDIDVFNAFSFGNNVQNMESIPSSSDPHDFLLPDALAMDIDQDWSWMLNTDYQMN